MWYNTALETLERQNEEAFRLHGEQRVFSEQIDFHAATSIMVAVRDILLSGMNDLGCKEVIDIKTSTDRLLNNYGSWALMQDILFPILARYDKLMRPAPIIQKA